MIDRTTLPIIPMHGTITAGQRFTVEGLHFDSWPNELVLGFSEDAIMNEKLVDSQRLMRLVSKSNTSLVFEAQVTFSYGVEHIWQYIGTPYATPRALLSYVEE